jgi:hypothetical protein
MKKFLSLIAVVFLLTQFTSLASDVDIRVVASRDTAINRAGNNLCFDLFVLNPNNDVNEIKFLVTCTINDSIIHALPIPGYFIKSDGTQDPTKWSKVLDTVAINSAHFRYWMGGDPLYFLGKSSNLRMIGTFYIKVGGGIPVHGDFKIKLEQINVTGVGNNSMIVNLSAPSTVSTTLNLGGNTSGDTNSLQLSTQPYTIDRPIHQARVRIAYKSPTISLDKITFDVWPQDLVPINIILNNPTGKVPKISNKIGDHYELSIQSAPNQTFPTSAIETLLAEIVLNFNPSASGARTIVMNNFKAWDASGQPISVTNALSQTLQLGQALPLTPDTLLLNATGSINRLNEEVKIDLSYSGRGWDTISFDYNLPNGFNFKGFDSKLTGLVSVINGSRITISINNQTITTPPNTWFQVFTVIFSYDKNITGLRTLTLDNIIAKQGNTALVVPTQPLSVNLDFGAKPPDTTKLVVNYSLFLDNNWFYLNRPLGLGTISLLWYMDNVVETTGAITFDMDLPYYMDLQQVVPLNTDGTNDVGQNIIIQKINDNGPVKTWRVVYSSKSINDPLLPNPQSKNPRPIMRLVIGFVDLPPWTLTIPVKNIVASGLDGRVINQTKSMDIAIDFLNKVYLPMFRKGDVNKQFGDGALTQADVDRLIKFLSKEIWPTLYEIWAGDLNYDVKIDAYDLTILQNLIGRPNTVEENNFPNEITVTGRLVSFNFPDDARIDFGVYDHLGRQIKHSSYSNSSGQVDLSDLNGGMYFIRVNKKVIKVLF